MRHSPLHNRGGTTNSIDKAAIEGFILYMLFRPHRFDN
jgi:hypothetical protein